MKTISCPKCDGSGKVPDQISLGKELRDLRLSSGISLRKMASFLFITPPYLSDMELGKRNWNPERQRDFVTLCRKSKRQLLDKGK